MKPTLHNLTTLVLGAFLTLWMLYANLCVPEFFSGGATTFGLLGVGLLVLMCLEGDEDVPAELTINAPVLIQVIKEKKTHAQAD